ncbi:homoserine dehydrogenase [Salsipaludibacter albus]|uniref:homoserine dehydrogenase n=1 Tax=Salsipaludibacter albus TaxID=2849650 RepID=UPI001EE4E6BC|nr:homoserine dehydrogenase [Salsipaludibacter albus]
MRIGMLGCGTVGSGVVTILARSGDDIAARAGVRLEIVRVAVRDLARDRGLPLSADVFTDRPEDVVAADDVDLVIEVMGGRGRAGDLVRSALANRKPVVTANKQLIAHEGPELRALAAEAGVDLMYEAAVAGAIPIIRPLKESLAGDRIRRVIGILNGTTNYILTRMTEEGASYDDVLAEAQELGYAEKPDPSADTGGHDAAAKTAILASLAFDSAVTDPDVFREGIERVTATDIAVARRLGYVVKLVGIASEVDGAVAVRVHPTFLPETHPLASVRLAFNAVYVEADGAGELMFYGPGAGSEPTGSAVLGDVVDVVRNLLQTVRGPLESTHRAATVRPMEDLTTQYYVLLDVEDRSGVLAAVAATFGQHDVSIAQVWQEGVGDHAQLVLITHRARESNLRSTVEALAATGGVRSVANVLRVESEGRS